MIIGTIIRVPSLTFITGFGNSFYITPITTSIVKKCSFFLE
ncbi:hypothetical protein CY0110_15767 [Crocosphaera chwakensis CCY0110]|uniref:Uncharacterized protein n=1 Tax=Crocosphaera chwakensis CCY0110 TaxID=391612 RepID=A3IHI5_9CHRO|nr:hypothetical protein CY0110_15767 [Crocosphaera chwakensis CCY0110]